MKKIKIIILCLPIIFAFSSCRDYLDIVPDNAISLDYFYSTKENAIKGLAKAYTYLPAIHRRDQTPWLLSDEYLGRTDWWNNADRYNAERIMRGFQNESDPFIGDWSGTKNGKPLYEAIRQCNIFLENIDNARDLTPIELTQWKAQVKFLKAYYHFLLIQKYGPIIIRDASIPLDAPKEVLYENRQKVDDCFNKVIELIDEAMPDLVLQSAPQDAGQVDQIAASAIKARIMLFRASPFFNGNSEYYNKFLDFDDEPFFPLTYDKEKWKDAIDACDDALEICRLTDKGLYEYTNPPYPYDRINFEKNPVQMKTLYDLRMKIVDPWNKELLWGYSNVEPGQNDHLYARCQIRNYPMIQIESLLGSLDQGYAASDLGASYAMIERYYSKNGLPLTEDTGFDNFSKHNIVILPDSTDAEYFPHIGIMQPKGKTIEMYLNRELRFYADLGLTGGYWRGHQWIIPLRMVANLDPFDHNNPSYGGKEMRGSMTLPNSTSTIDRGDVQNECLSTGIGIQKLVHPESVSGAWQRMKRYAMPMIRYADLLLMKAEAMNEYYDPGTPQRAEGIEALNLVRRRAGIPDVEVSWGSTLGLARTIDKHKTREGLRDIILYERGVELAFEGSRFWDMHRHKRATREFSQPVFGWDREANNEEDFFQLQLLQARRFTITDCLWPIDIAELNRQGTLKQNPGWR